MLSWVKGRLHERDLRFVDLGRYLLKWAPGNIQMREPFLEERLARVFTSPTFAPVSASTS
jgi:hypothetical protein